MRAATIQAGSIPRDLIRRRRSPRRVAKLGAMRGSPSHFAGQWRLFDESAVSLAFLDHAPNQKRHAASPGFVRVATQVDGFSEQHLASYGIFDLNVDIENQIAYLLDPAN